jgi:hypothetical protein
LKKEIAGQALSVVVDEWDVSVYRFYSHVDLFDSFGVRESGASEGQRLVAAFSVDLNAGNRLVGELYEDSVD